jgi:hypothetical protein
MPGHHRSIGPFAESKINNPETTMKILSYRPAPSGGGNTLCHVDIEIVSGVRLYGLRVAQMPDRTFRVFGPNTDRQGRSMSFDPFAVDAIAQAAMKTLEMDERSRNDHRFAS